MSSGITPYDNNFRRMGTQPYDEAILDKVKESWSNVIYANTAITYNTIYQLGDGQHKEMKVPLINIYRPSGFELTDMQNFSARRQGQILGATDGDTLRGRFLSATLIYQFDFYDKTYEQLNATVIQFMQTMNAIPMLEVKHKDAATGFEFVEYYELQYLGGPEEQSEFDSNNHVYRYYVQYEIKKAKLYDFTEVKNIETVKAEGRLELEVSNEE